MPVVEKRMGSHRCVGEEVSLFKRNNEKQSSYCQNHELVFTTVLTQQRAYTLTRPPEQLF